MIPQFQVFAIGFQDRKLYIRTGVSYMELSGRGWKLIDLPSKKNIDEDVESLTESMSSMETSTNEKPTNPVSDRVSQRSIRSITLPSMMAPTLRKRGDDTVIDSYVHEMAGIMVRTIALQTDPPQRPQSEMPPGIARLLSDRLGELKGLPVNGRNIDSVLSNNSTAVVHSSPEDSGFDNSKKNIQNVESSEGLTLEELEADRKAPSRSREGSWSSNYSDTIVNFVFDGDESLEPVQFLDAECCKGTQTDWDDVELVRCQLEEMERANQKILESQEGNKPEQLDHSDQCNNEVQNSLDNSNNMQNNMQSVETAQEVSENSPLCSASSRINSEDDLSRTSDDRTRMSTDHLSLQSEEEADNEADVSIYEHMTLCDSTPVRYSKLSHGSGTSMTGSVSQMNGNSRMSGLSDSGISTLSDPRLSALLGSRVQRSASEPSIAPLRK